MNKLTSIISEKTMHPPLEVRIRMLKETKFELLGEAIRGVENSAELKIIGEKLKKYGRLRREKKKEQKKSN